MIESVNILKLLKERSNRSSFHTAAEKHVRVEFRNMASGQTIGPITYNGDIVLTCYAGEFQLEMGTNAAKLGEFDQVVVPHGSPMKVACVLAGTVQLIWSPPQAPTSQSIGD